MRGVLWVVVASVYLHTVSTNGAPMTCPTHEADARGLEVPDGQRCCLGSNNITTANSHRMACVAGTSQGLHWLPALPMGFVVYASHDTVATPPGWAIKQRCPVGREVAAYVHFIVDNWDCLPDQVVFLHSHRWNWHTFYFANSVLPGWNMYEPVDTVEMMNRMCWDKAAAKGYLPLHPVEASWNKGLIKTIEDSIAPDALRNIATGVKADIDVDKKSRKWHCCAQFVVTRDTIHARGLDFWKGLMKHMCDHNNHGDDISSKHDAYNYALVFEMLWDEIMAPGAKLGSLSIPKEDLYACSSGLPTSTPPGAPMFDPTPHLKHLPQPPTPVVKPVTVGSTTPSPQCPLHVDGIVDGEGAAASRQCCRKSLGKGKGKAWSGRMATANNLVLMPRGAKPEPTARDQRYMDDFSALLFMDFAPSREDMRWPADVYNPVVCKHAGPLAAAVQNIISNWDCLPNWVSFVVHHDDKAVWSKGGGPSPALFAGTIKQPHRHYELLKALCFDLIHSGYMSFCLKRVDMGTVAPDVMVRIQDIWGRVLGKDGDAPTTFSYFPTEEAVMSRARLQSVGLPVFKAMLADMCHGWGSTPWQVAVTQEAYRVLWSTHIVGREDDFSPLSSLDAKGRKALVSCNNTAHDSASQNLRTDQA